MKHLILWRHALAEYVAGKDDSLRELTDEGRIDAGCAASGLKKLVAGKSSLIVSSPKIRARDTANYLKAAVPDIELKLDEAVCDGDIKALVSKYGGSCDWLIVVGHEPDLSCWHYDLTDKRVQFLDKAGAALYEMQGGHWNFIWRKGVSELAQ